jgi:hypothetical protein
MIALGAALILAGAAATPSPSPSASSALSATDVAGIWKLCYEPGLPGVNEVSAAYLVLMPDFEYYEIREDCCRPDNVERPNPGYKGRYSIEGHEVVQHCVDVHGKPYDRRLKLVPAAAVVTFDARKGPVVRGPVLQIGENLNYGYIKVFWDNDWLAR